MGWRRMAVFGDCQATTLTTQPPQLVLTKHIFTAYNYFVSFPIFCLFRYLAKNQKPSKSFSLRILTEFMDFTFLLSHEPFK